MTVFERLSYNFDIDKLQDYLYNTVLKIGDPVCPTAKGYGGWSVTSQTGDWKDGWRAKGQGVHPPEKYNKPTPLYTGYIVEVLDCISQDGFEPTKVRISQLPPNGKSSIHRDYPPSMWRARLHIPILTNDKCCHIIYSMDLKEQTKYHMAADGSAYILWVNLKHQYFNLSDKYRYHVVIDVQDTKGITENFKCIK